jgi:hypothetical protein
MKRVSLLLEGGVAGHLSHLYDNRGFTFSEISAILQRATAGQLVGTEKTDGFNIYLGAREGIALYARNKGDMSIGGRSLDDLKMREFAGGESIKNVYLKAFQAFQNTVSAMSPQQQASIFGPNGEIFYNTEIQGPGASNVVNYDANIVSIHHGGHKMFDSTNNKVLAIPKVDDVAYAEFVKRFPNIDIERASQHLNSTIDAYEQRGQKEDFKVRRTAALQLNELSSGEALQDALQRMQQAGFSGDMTIEEYMASKLEPMINQRLANFPSSIQAQVVDKILDRKSEDGKTINLAQIYKGYSKEGKQAIRDVVADKKKFLNVIIFPIEDAIHDFSVEVLKGLQSAYILDNKAELERLRREVKQAIENIHAYTGPGREEAHDVLKRQLKKLKSHDNINTTVEGFVFEYKGTLYKFTGNFAPINQLLGLFKYGRGTVPPIKSLGSSQLSEGIIPLDVAIVDNTRVLSNYSSIALFPGGFKPPTRAHFAAASELAGVAELPIIIMGHGAKTNKRQIGGKDVDFDTSMAIWSLYSDTLPGDLYLIESPPGGNPMKIAYDILQNASEGQTIYMASGAKDAKRFQGQAEKYVPDGVSLQVEVFPDIAHSSEYMKLLNSEESQEIKANMPSLKKGKNEKTLHASDLRYLAELSAQNMIAKNLFADFIPPGVDPATVLSTLGIQPTVQVSEVLYRIVNESYNNILEIGRKKQEDPLQALGQQITGVQAAGGQQVASVVPGALEQAGEAITGAVQSITAGGTEQIQKILQNYRMMQAELEKKKQVAQEKQQSKQETEQEIASKKSLEEISSGAGGAAGGYAGSFIDDDEEEETLIREVGDETLFTEILKYLSNSGL